jgi:fused signal recognition particle receptor
MFKFLKKDKSDAARVPSQEAETPQPETVPDQPEAPLEQRLERSRGQFSGRLKAMFRIRKKIDADLLEELETLLLTADVGVEASQMIIDGLTQRIKRRELDDSEAVLGALRSQLLELLAPCESPLLVDANKQPFVILIVGVNGAGKTTTIGKLAKRFSDAGLKVMLAAGDTFRAAAVEQLQRWGERNQVQVIAQSSGADSASVVFDALEAARARGMDVLIADTAGRLHTQSNLMDELAKIKRVMGKLEASAPHEVLLVIDGGTGQNAINQTEQFNQAIGVTGIAVTKLDGTAKGGILFALARKFGIPFRFIGVGEGIGDLRGFDSREFVEALLPESR